MAVHLIQRGNNRSACFRGDEDYLVYLANLRQLSAKYDCAVHAYCLMTNHVHLLLTPGEEGALPGLMRDLGQRYVQYFNRRHGRSGTLWEGRYRSCLVESRRYVLACYRYIELNPMRAAMVNHPSSYLWSSHAVNSGMRSDPFLAEHPEFVALASDATLRHAVYRRLFQTSIEEVLVNAIREATNAGYPLVSDALLARIGSKRRPGKPGPAAMSPAGVYLLS
ncbi:MAG TPA: transposase [Burkholderiales bacterium]|nr:transposase [Burkholderiales bacterium]